MVEIENLEEEWKEFKNDEITTAYWLMPMALFYSGFFGGPFFTLVIAVLVTRLRLDSRWSLFLVGASGTTWCLIQGLTMMYISVSEPLTIQFLRSFLNLLFGLVSFWIVRKWGTEEGYFSNTRTLIFTVGLGVLSGIIFLFPPSKIMMAIGR